MPSQDLSAMFLTVAEFARIQPIWKFSEPLARSAIAAIARISGHTGPAQAGTSNCCSRPSR